jgi:bifunctional DNA-binding transcriptional regulator/antitoxin component of YhaV-PrlF toxin-antitoxin module
MSVIPETRTIGDRRRINIPQHIAEQFGDGERFDPTVREEIIVLTPTADPDAHVLTDKNRIRLPEQIVSDYDADTEFAVFTQDGEVVLKPDYAIDISL